MESTLYERLGGEKAVNAAVDVFYARVLNDQRLRPFFVDADMESLKRHQRLFLTVAFGGPNRYSGATMKAAHQRLVARGLDDTHFDMVIEHLGMTLAKMGVTPALITEAAIIAESTRHAVLGRV